MHLVKLTTLIIGLSALIPSASAAEPSVKPKHNLRSAVLATPWTWEHPTAGKTILRFYQDGIARNTRPWQARWEATGLKTLTIDMPGQKGKATLTFTDDFTSFQAIHFDQATVFRGVPAPEPARATPIPKK